MPFNQREPRTKQLACAVSEEEKSLVAEWAETLGQSVSDFLRDAVKNHIDHCSDKYSDKPKRAHAR